MSPGDLEQIRQQTEFLRSKMPQRGTTPVAFDAAAVKELSDEVNRMRGSLDEKKEQIVANLYGLFLGEALLRANRHADGKWVRLKNGDVAICWQKPKGDMQVMFSMPISRVFKQLEHGETYSMYSLFLSMSKVLSGQTPVPQSPQTPRPNAAVKRTGASPAKAPQAEGWFAKFRRILNRI
jgi:hypothetical protein